MTRLVLENYRCFESLDLRLEPDLTLIFAENGGGKSAALSALASGLRIFSFESPQNLELYNQRDVRKIAPDERSRREPAGQCRLDWTACIGQQGDVTWSGILIPSTNVLSADLRYALKAMEHTRVGGARWPLFAYYGTGRMGHGTPTNQPARGLPTRWEGYDGCLDDSYDDSALLTWLLEEILSDTVNRQEGEKERQLAALAMNAVTSATPGIQKVWFDPRERSPVVRFKSGQVATWAELSDGFHVHLALVADIARRALILNEHDGQEALEKVEGVVLIDEIDLHLYPRWQRVVLGGLQRTFPKLQFVVTTHSPQVLSSALNRQVRLLVDGKLVDRDLHLEGRDSNAILRDFMNTDDRDPMGQGWLRELYQAIDNGRIDVAKELIADLESRWGSLDPAIVRARGFMEDRCDD